MHFETASWSMITNENDKIYAALQPVLIRYDAENFDEQEEILYRHGEQLEYSGGTNYYVDDLE